MYLALIALPLIGAIVGGFRGRSLGVTGSQLITTGCLMTSAVLALIAFYEVALCRSPVSITLGTWVDIEYLHVEWSFLFDDLTVSMLLAVLIVSSLVHLYSIDYMASDPHPQRFIALLSTFTGFMVILVTSDNLFGLFVGWEGIGVSSYLLISFWLTRLQANKSAVKALTVNRVGDMALSIGFLLVITSMGTLDYATMFSIAPLFNETIITVIGLLFLGGAMSKSANVPLHTWLPDAMEGPTPVSALIHAATLVTAGVYLLLRSSPILEYGPTALIVITWVGALTAFFAATTGLLQNDLKRVIAYSTCSQMGYLVMAIGTSQYATSLFHLVNHAYFKALLFLSAGAVLHGMSDQQDLRRLGGLVSFLPFTYTAMTIGSLSLMALPFMTGFYSKDAILELAYGRYEVIGSIAYYAGTISAMFTAFYSYRLISMTFFTVPNAPKNDYLHVHEASLIVIVPLTILSILAIFFGYVAKDLFVGPGTDFLSSALFTAPNHLALIDAEFSTPLLVKLLPAILTLVGALSAIYLYHYVPAFTISLTDSKLGRDLYTFFNAKWAIDGFITSFFILPAMRLGYIASKVLDRGVIELAGPFGLTSVMTDTSSSIASYDTGTITTYALYMSIGVLTLLLMVFSPTILPAGSSSIDLLTSAGLVMVMLVSLVMMPSTGSNDTKVG